MKVPPTPLRTLYALVSVLSVCVGGAFASHIGRPGPDERAIMDAVRGGHSLWVTSAVVPAELRNRGMSHADLMKMLRHIRQGCREYYAGKPQRTCILTLSIAAREDRQGRFLVLGGAVKTIDFGSVAVINNTARVQARVHDWIRTGVRHKEWMHVEQGDTVRDFVFVLRKMPDGWRIYREDWTFAPGSGP